MLNAVLALIVSFECGIAGIIWEILEALLFGGFPPVQHTTVVSEPLLIKKSTSKFLVGQKSGKIVSLTFKAHGGEVGVQRCQRIINARVGLIGNKNMPSLSIGVP